MVEIVLSVLAFLAILLLARAGMVSGSFLEVVTTLLLFLAMMVTLRYWYLVTHWILTWWTGDNACYAAFGAYWTLFLLGCSPLILVLQKITTDSIPRYPKFLDMILGLIFGAISGALLVCCVMTSLSVIAPKVWEPYNREVLLLPLDTMPLRIYQAVEHNLLHIGADDPAHTRLPTLVSQDADRPDKYWK